MNFMNIEIVSFGLFHLSLGGHCIIKRAFLSLSSSLSLPFPPSLQYLTSLDVFNTGTGDCRGMIEAVPNSITLAQMVAEHARGSKFKAARTVFGDKAIILRWLCENHNIDYIQFEQNLNRRTAQEQQQHVGHSNNLPPHHHSNTGTIVAPMSREMHDAVQNFAASCAGSVVFTYVLGIGDRHNDNIMLQKSGKLFHIDFGHFLGNFKSKFGVKRETAPFIFTPAMAHVLHALPNGFQRFEELACRAFNVLRQHSTLLVSLFSLMLSCGIPELKTMTDIQFLEKKLMLGATNEEASLHLKNQIALSLKTKMTQVNDAVHVMRHH